MKQRGVAWVTWVTWVCEICEVKEELREKFSKFGDVGDAASWVQPHRASLSTASPLVHNTATLLTRCTFQGIETLHLYDSGTSAAALAILNLIFSTTNRIRCKQQAHTLPEVMLKMRWMPWCAPDLVWHHAIQVVVSHAHFKEGKTDILGQEVRVTMASQALRRRDSCDAVMPSWHEPCRVHLPGEKGCGGDLKTTKMIDESNMCIFGLWSGIRRWEGPLSHLLRTCHIFIALHPTMPSGWLQIARMLRTTQREGGAEGRATSWVYK